jgi:hypothetical protein
MEQEVTEGFSVKLPVLPTVTETALEVLVA